MTVEFSDDEFMRACGLNQEESDFSNDDRAILHAIFIDFKTKHDQFTEIAVSLSRLIQKLPGVHSVRWRIKDPYHLVKKIARKKAAGVAKYATISPENYRDVVTDLIGIRALHLFKGDFPTLHRSIIETWELDENPVAYVRKGDTEELRTLYRELELEVEEHNDGYRSIHYITKTNFTKTTVKCELQVRTIFEEGWSEIDHKVRYPDFSNDPLIRDFLHIFNRLSGAADEMGTFVNRLAADLTALTDKQATAVSRASEIEKQLSEKIQKIEALSSKHTSMQSEMKELKALIARQKAELQIGAGSFGSIGLDMIKLDSDIRAGSDILRTLNISPSLYDDAVFASKNIIDAGKIAARAVELVKKKKD